MKWLWRGHSRSCTIERFDRHIVLLSDKPICRHVTSIFYCTQSQRILNFAYSSQSSSSCITSSGFLLWPLTGLLARQVGLNQSLVTEWAKTSWRSLKKWKCVFISRRCRYGDLIKPFNVKSSDSLCYMIWYEEVDCGEWKHTQRLQSNVWVRLSK